MKELFQIVDRFKTKNFKRLFMLNLKENFIAKNIHRI